MRNSSGSQLEVRSFGISNAKLIALALVALSAAALIFVAIKYAHAAGGHGNMGQGHHDSGHMNHMDETRDGQAHHDSDRMNHMDETRDGQAHHDSGHMKHMNEVREMLKQKLGAEYDKPLPLWSKADLAKGKALYEQNCVACHGVTGKGDGPAAAGLPSPPANFTDAAHAGFYSGRGRLWIIRNGVPGTSMVGWSGVLGEEGTRQVYSYVRSLAGEPKASHAGDDHAQHDHH